MNVNTRSGAEPSGRAALGGMTPRRIAGVVLGMGCVVGACLGIFGPASSAHAYPPAPHHSLYGYVRDQWGDPIDVSSATVYLQASNTVGLVKASITASTEPGVNYRLNVPMDSGVVAGLYTPTALRRSQPFQLKVVIGRATFLPLEMALGSPTLGQPGEATRLDLTLGEDTDGDGLPDAWEEAIIAALGGTLESVTPNGDADGDGISNLNEYLAGTYAFDPEDGLRLAIAGVGQSGPRLEFLAVRGRTYSIQASSDLQQWSEVGFRVVSGQSLGEQQTSYPSGDVRLLQLEVSVVAGTTNRFFKALVR